MFVLTGEGKASILSSMASKYYLGQDNSELYNTHQAKRQCCE